jgi:hypothetical protein
MIGDTYPQHLRVLWIHDVHAMQTPTATKQHLTGVIPIPSIGSPNPDATGSLRTAHGSDNDPLVQAAGALLALQLQAYSGGDFLLSCSFLPGVAFTK